MGLKAYFCFVADPEFGTKIMACRIPCLCPGCKARFDLPTKEQRYANQRDDCTYWSMYKIDENSGYNDWVKLHFELTNDCDEDEFVESQLEAIGGIADLMRRQAHPGGIGAYLVEDVEDEDELENDDNVKYYLVKWAGIPFQASVDDQFDMGNTLVRVKAGEWLCKAKWLYELDKAPNWYFLKPRKKTYRADTASCRCGYPTPCCWSR